MKRFQVRKLVTALSIAGLFVYSSHAMASAFQLWEQDAASVGNYHAGYAAAAYDASTAFYNPAGINRFKEQQFVLAGDAIITDFKYKGTVGVNTIQAGQLMSTTSQGGNFAMLGAMHYVAPYNDAIAFGLSVDVPFGLKVNYGKQTPLQFASTVTSIRVIDISPVVSFKFNDHLSFGIGPDAQITKGEFDSVAALGGGGISNTTSVNIASDTGYGFHGGLLYEINENTRVGLSYHSQVVHHLTGNSTFSGPLAALGTEADTAVLRASGSRLNLTLPPYTALSAYHKINSNVAVMGTVVYTQWSVLRNLILQNVSGISADLERSTTLLVTIPQYFHNSYSASVGADYFLTDKITLRGGIGVDQTPINNAYRNVQLPDSTRYAFAVGGHIQSTQTLGFDLGWTHIFMNQVTVNPPAQTMGAAVVTTNGQVNGGADVMAAQVVWDMV